MGVIRQCAAGSRLGASENLQPRTLHPTSASNASSVHSISPARFRRGCRFSEGLDTVKDMTEKSLDNSAMSLLNHTESTVKDDMSKDFSSYGHHMWDLK
mmetsp:Transcript_58883/g.134715  ORF Transcript_58883/g.134715 Transcript_58883/m.134715 type:complete len:99 (+) Transcript_58883:391-687(+)